MNYFKINRDLYEVLAFFMIMFAISPAIFMPLILVLVFMSNDKRFSPYLLAFFVIYFICVQSTRTFSPSEASDWAGNYYINFNAVSSLSFKDYLQFQNKEPGWQIINFISYYLLSGNFLLFGNLITIVTFLLIGLSAYKYWQHTGFGIRYLVMSLVLVYFFSQFWSFSNNILRQQFAMSIMIYAIVQRATTGHVNILLLITSVTVHNMTILFIPLLYLIPDRKLSHKLLVYLLVIFAIVAIMMKYAGAMAGSDIYAVQRFSTGSDYVGSGNDIMDSSDPVYAFIIVVLAFYVKAIYINKTNWTSNYYINNFFLILMMFCLMFSSMPMFQVRYYCTRFYFMPLVFPYLFVNDHLANKIYIVLACLFFMTNYWQANYLFFDMQSLVSKNLFSYILPLLI